MEFAGKIAFISGSTRGIGLEIASLLADKGCYILLNGAHDLALGENLIKVFHKEGKAVSFLPGDVSKADDVEKVALFIEEIGRLDILVSNVGWIKHRAWDEYTEKDWEENFNINLKSAWLCAKYLHPFMPEGSSILNISSTSAFRPEGDALLYSMAKAALLSFTKGLALLLAPKTRVNALAPGYVQTSFDPQDRLQEETISSLIPLKRFGKPKEIAQLACSILENEYLTGSIFTIDGGESLL